MSISFLGRTNMDGRTTSPKTMKSHLLSSTRLNQRKRLEVKIKRNMKHCLSLLEILNNRETNENFKKSIHEIKEFLNKD